MLRWTRNQNIQKVCALDIRREIMNFKTYLRIYLYFYCIDTWTVEEDVLLKRIINESGPTSSWSNVSTRIPGRTPKQCRERWYHHLDTNIRKGNWTNQEDNAILEAQKQIGNQWSKVAAILTGRTDIDVKNRFHKLQLKEAVIKRQKMLLV